MNNPIILANNLSFSYNGQTVLENVDLTINKNDFVWIVGPNGGGKTTLLKLFLGLLKPKNGTIKIFDNSPQKARRYIGYMPQYISLDKQFPVNVIDVVLMGRLGNGEGVGPFGSSDKEIAKEVLHQVGLYKYRQKQFSELSGGQQRRLLIARALASKPKILLLDEPTANLDVTSEKELYELLQKLNEDITIILVSHDPAFVSDFVKRAVCVNREVHEHPTTSISGLYVSEFYGGERRIVRHDKHIEKN
ncbi:MAG: ABC transporter ATP-binding protein [candidate division Zixibacteria bacterium]|nr:ABC transporter ATP-binding protein [candidate division Zixibacteria bacterium]